MEQVQPVRAIVPRRRGVRARVGVLENVPGAAGDGQSSEGRWMLGNGLCVQTTTRTRCPCKRPSCLCISALAYQKNILECRAILRSRILRLGRHEEAIPMKRDVYSGRLKLNGEEHVETLITANNYGSSLARRSASKKPSH